MNTEQSRDTCQLNELSVGGEQALVTPEVLAAAGGSPAPTLKAPTLNEAMYLLAKLRDEKYYPKGGYSSDVRAEWGAMLDAWFGEVRPCF